MSTPDGQAVRTGDVIADIAIGSDQATEPAKLYMVWQDGRFKNNGLSGIAFATSTDGGTTWTTPIRVDTATTAAFNAAVDVDSTGRVAVVYYAFDEGQTTSANAKVYARTLSADGTTWSDATALTGSFDAKKAPIARGHFLGDYIGLTHAGTTFYANPAITTDAAYPNSQIVLVTF